MNLNDIERAYPEWGPWLAVMGALREALQDATWYDRLRVNLAPRHAGAPLLAQAAVSLDASASELFHKLCQRAAQGGASNMNGFETLGSAEIDHTLLQSVLNGDESALVARAHRAGVEAEAFVAVASLVALPLLHALSRRLSGEIPAGWMAGYCPVCGAWPTLAEVCGVERARQLRCGRCGSGWRAHCLSCPYCGTSEHDQMGSLEVEDDGSKTAVEVCGRCAGYLKRFMRLRGGSHEEVLMSDLMSVTLDLAAVERGYRRPAGLGYAIAVTVSEPAPERMFHS
jgi:FdhE protein